jgi:hypothetical protein
LGSRARSENDENVYDAKALAIMSRASADRLLFAAPTALDLHAQQMY